MAEVGFLYINGLGNGKTKPKDRFVHWWWQWAGLQIEHAHVDWYDGGSLDEKLDAVEQKVTEMLTEFSGVAIIGSSAGGSLAINTFYRLRNKNVCAVNERGRLKDGGYPHDDRNSLYHRAHLDSNRPSQSFYDSVEMAETLVLPALTPHDKERLLVLTQLTDLVVPLETMRIKEVTQHRSRAFGHSGGFIAHFLADRDLIANFAQQVLE